MITSIVSRYPGSGSTGTVPPALKFFMAVNSNLKGRERESEKQTIFFLQRGSESEGGK